MVYTHAHKQNSLTFNGEDGDLLSLRGKLIQLCVERDSSSSKSSNCSAQNVTANNDDHNHIMDVSSDISTTLHDPLSRTKPLKQ